MMAEFTYQVMQALRQTDEWDRLWKEDPSIQQAKAQLEAVMERVGLKVPGQLVDSLWSAVYELTSASEDAAMLYGIRVMEAIHGVAANPTEFSRYAFTRKAEALHE